MHDPESVLDNETRKLHRDFEIQTDHLILARQPDLIIINKRKLRSRSLNFVSLSDMIKDSYRS